MDYTSGMDVDELNVSESAFWHSNMDLYYGYQPGEIVEVEHESNKYWLASIEYSYKHLILLKWVGNYGEFWVDASAASNGVYNEQSTSRRIYPPGHHLQSQLKSQFTLERPTTVLEKPSFYNPSNDPYAEIKTVDDLLAHENDDSGTDAFGSKSLVTSGEPGIQLVKMTKTNLNGHDDLAELLAAIESLNPENEVDRSETSSQDCNSTKGTETAPKTGNFTEKSDPSVNFNVSDKPSEIENKLPVSEMISGKLEPKSHESPEASDESGIAIDHDACLDLCRKVQDSAISKGRYLGIEDNSKKVYYLKPKQFFDLGGANHERVLVPGTIVEVCHTVEIDSRLELCHWFAIVVKNVGGRLTLRWFLTDEPKFKQGRLELKSCRSVFIREEEESDGSEDGRDEEKWEAPGKAKLPVKNITFCMHFCNPCIHTVSHAKSTNRSYRMPGKLFSFIQETRCTEEAHLIEITQKDHIFDIRRMNLDKDRPMIDHLLSTVRWVAPQYVNLSYAPKDKDNRREILLSTSKTTKLVRGFVKRELEAGVFEIHSEPLGDSAEVIKFIYPYDSAYSILPTSWAINNEDCLSIHPSRNPTPTPTPTEKSSVNGYANVDNVIGADKIEPICSETESSCRKIPSQNCQDQTIEEPLLSGNYELLCEIPKTVDTQPDGPTNFDELEPSCLSRLCRNRELEATEFKCTINCSRMEEILTKFKVMDQLEVVHPSSDVTICLGRIRKIVYPLLWIQISADSYTLLPFNSTDIYPTRWCEINNHPLVSLLPPRKRINQISSQQSDTGKKRKKAKTDDVDSASIKTASDSQPAVYEKEHFDLGALNDKQLDIDYILNEKSMYIRIFFNHKCFTGPSLSKGKICSLPQYVGPGPLRLVMEEVVTKIISVAYVPPRILNDLSSKTFEELLIARNMTNTTPMEFKAKYQKRVHREDIPVCLNPDDVALYCECICEHLKCCYNLFGPVLYDGDDCPGHCRALTKSNKFMKRATYYREKARLGEFTNDNGANKKSSQSNSASKTSRPRYAGRDSSESTSSSISRSEQLNSRASSAADDISTNELKENLGAVKEIDDEDEDVKNSCDRENIATIRPVAIIDTAVAKTLEEPEVDRIVQQEPEKVEQNVNQSILMCKPPIKWPNDSEFDMLDERKIRPESWTIEDVAEHLEWCRLGRFKPHMISEGVDGQALMLLDRAAIREHFQFQTRPDYSPEEVGKLCRFVEFVKARAELR